MNRQTLLKELENITGRGRVLSDEPLLRHCSFRTGGPADLFVRTGTADQLRQVLALLKAEGVETFLLGRGTNLLIGDKGFKGAVITMTDTASEKEAESEGREPLRRISVSGTTLTAGAGASLQSIALTAARYGLSGLEFAAGIPGSLGGGIVMNAGAYDGEMKQVVREVTLLEDGEIRTLTGEEMQFAYRTSYMKSHEGAVL